MMGGAELSLISKRLIPKTGCNQSDIVATFTRLRRQTEKNGSSGNGTYGVLPLSPQLVGGHKFAKPHLGGGLSDHKRCALHG
jgi:hypothetical protein